MTFLLPLGLLALLTLPIILILHLLRERRRRVRVPSLLHWLDLPRRPEGERIRRLPLTLLLLLHLLVAGLLGVALGQPQLSGAPNNAARQTAIVIDTSTSMAAGAGTTTRFAQAQTRARALLRELRPSDRATLIAAGPAARVVAEGGAGDLAALTTALDQLRPGGDGSDMAGALTLAAAALDPQRERRIVAFSDGAVPVSSEATGNNRAAEIAIDWQIVGNEQSNRAIVDFAMRPWGGKLQIYTRIANYDAAPFGAVVQLYGDDRLLDTRRVSMDGDGQTELTWTLPASYATLRASLDGRDALPEDDQGFLAVAPPPPITALLVSAQPDTLRRALAAAGAQISVVDPSSYDQASAAEAAVDLTIFDGFLPSAWPAGAVLAINPPTGSTLIAVDSSSNPAPDDELVQRSALLDGLSFGGVSFGLIQSIQPPPWASVQLALGDQPLIVRGRDGSREIAIWTFDLASSNLPTRLAFPLLVARTVRDLTPAPLPTAIRAGASLRLRASPQTTSIAITEPDGVRVTVPTTSSLTLDTLTQPGFYNIEAAGADGQVGVNAGSVIESDLRQRMLPTDPSATTESTGGWTAPLSVSADPQRQMTDLWPWLALGALALLMLEWGYIHR
jgi:Ca-activated chloride channel homolog